MVGGGGTGVVKGGVSEEKRGELEEQLKQQVGRR